MYCTPRPESEEREREREKHVYQSDRTGKVQPYIFVSAGRQLHMNRPIIIFYFFFFFFAFIFGEQCYLLLCYTNANKKESGSIFFVFDSNLIRGEINVLSYIEP